jgi:hypothetical protein
MDDPNLPRYEQVHVIDNDVPSTTLAITIADHAIETKSALVAECTAAYDVLSISSAVPKAGPMVAHITVQGPESADLTRDFFAWLVDESDLRGLVRIVEGEPSAYALGVAEVALDVVLGPGGTATVLATVAITWLRCRTGRVTVSFSSGDDKGRDRVSVVADRVRNLDAEGIRDVIAQVSDVLRDGQPGGSSLECSGDEHDGA